MHHCLIIFFFFLHLHFPCFLYAWWTLSNTWPILGGSRWAKKMSTCASSNHSQDGCNRLELWCTTMTAYRFANQDFLLPTWKHAIVWIGLESESQCTSFLLSFSLFKIIHILTLDIFPFPLHSTYRLRLVLSLLSDRSRSCRRRSTDWKVRIINFRIYLY